MDYSKLNYKLVGLIPFSQNEEEKETFTYIYVNEEMEVAKIVRIINEYEAQITFLDGDEYIALIMKLPINIPIRLRS